MAKKHYIKKAIEKFIAENSLFFVEYSNWYIGITANPNVRHRQHRTPSLWLDWCADCVDDARDIEYHFLEKGMRGNVGGGTKPKYVYVYKKAGPYSW